MTKTNTQNRPYGSEPFPMIAVFLPVGETKEVLNFDWNDRAQVRNFAAQSDRIVRAGGTTILGRTAVHLAAAPEEVEKWQKLSLARDAVAREELARLLHADALATGHQYSDVAAVYSRRVADLEAELEAVKSERDDLADELHQLRFGSNA